MRRLLSRLSWRRLFVREVWAIGIIPIAIDEIVLGTDMPEPEWIVVPSYGRFYADPFLMQSPGGLQIVFERWSALQGRGWIASMSVAHPVANTAVRAIDLACHMSYPSIVEIDQNLFCVPETWEIGGAWLHRYQYDQQAWIRVHQILPGVPLIDPTIFQHEDRWWLFGTIRGRAPEHNLFAWHSESPFDVWKPHRLSPIKSDLASARPAGNVFRIGDKIYRPGQDCRAGYGSAVSINRIVELTPEAFAEVAVKRIAPGPDWAFPDGMHTINGADGLTVVDGKRMAFDPLGPVLALVPSVRRFLRRVKVDPIL